jgi:hypothetical protein
MLTIAIAVLIFGVSATFLSLGVMLKKKTPLKAGCGGSAGHPKTGEKEQVCDGCSCDKVSAR